MLAPSLAANTLLPNPLAEKWSVRILAGKPKPQHRVPRELHSTFWALVIHAMTFQAWNGMQCCVRLRPKCMVPRVVAAGTCAQCLPEAKAVVKALREEHGAKAVGAQGFCWGGACIKTLLCCSIAVLA